jgi:inositol 1,4,5-triphosphate receptor type 1
MLLTSLITRWWQEEGITWVTDEDNDEDPVTATEIAYAYFNILLRLQDFTGENYRQNPQHHPKTTEEDDEVLVTASMLGVELMIMFADLFFYERAGRLGGDFSRWQVAQGAFPQQMEGCHSVYNCKQALTPLLRSLDPRSSEVKHQLVWEVDRSSPSNRLHDFVDRCKNIMADIRE